MSPIPRGKFHDLSMSLNCSNRLATRTAKKGDLMDPKKQALRIEELVAQGMTVAEAAEKIIRESQAPALGDERMKFIRESENIEVLQELNHKAHAKLSKEKYGKAKPAALARYREEISSTKMRIEALKAKASASPTALQDLVRLGSKPSGVIQFWLKTREDEVEPKLKEVKKLKGWTNPQLKDAIGKASTVIPEVFVKELKAVGDDYLKNVTDRIERGDQRVVALVRKWNLVS
jgi:hypothetical protein